MKDDKTGLALVAISMQSGDFTFNMSELGLQQAVTKLGSHGENVAMTVGEPRQYQMTMAIVNVSEILDVKSWKIHKDIKNDSQVPHRKIVRVLRDKEKGLVLVATGMRLGPFAFSLAASEELRKAVAKLGKKGKNVAMTVVLPGLHKITMAIVKDDEKSRDWDVFAKCTRHVRYDTVTKPGKHSEKLENHPRDRACRRIRKTFEIESFSDGGSVESEEL
ncbi:hypothetical protein K491DRAFT_716081 [Lophiostoma macrostomum CBS 122681]|uniref:Uncharacterized protein n=1 Tax=Lophiostoma macrostomum CBS 122681 TaxID=1314788 RepID=A0A6A6T7B1_9PLEO|nr:hypothetical protein K491DRAFT_716081 [Lophiostoma macrostomum CBS 122681]